jgi:phospholipid-binding lipoprotein MlaA
VDYFKLYLFKKKRVWVFLYLVASLVLVSSNNSMASEKLYGAATDRNSTLIASLSDDNDVNDPLELINRPIFQFNEFILELLLRPISDAYNDNLPAVFRVGVRNFLSNLSTPISVANHLFQGEPDEALRSVGRLLTNTIAGVGGLADVASELNAPGRKEDFGQTLGVWGVNEGIYLVLPIFGPSNPRDLVGKFIIDPYFNATGNWISNTDKNSIDWSIKATSGVSEYAGVVNELNQVKKTSIDYYAAIRSLYRQKRKSEISNGKLIELPAIPDLSYELSPSIIPKRTLVTN